MHTSRLPARGTAQPTAASVPAWVGRPPPVAALRLQRSAALGCAHRRCRRLQPVVTAVSAAEEQTASGNRSLPELNEAKQRLLAAAAGTERGAGASGLRRGEVEEAQVAVERYAAGQELDFELLCGSWRLCYTTARDVLPLVAPQRPPALVQVGAIYQRFSSLAEGRVQNVIEARLPPPPPLALLAPDAWLEATLVVEASYEPRTARSIALSFLEAGVRGATPSPALQNLLASPLLPRGWWNQQALLALKQLSLSVPLVTRLPGAASEQRQPVGLNYMLTYLDDDMLIGRAQGNGGVFVFTRAAEGERAEEGSE